MEERCMEKILNEYYKDNAKKLCGVINQIFRKKYGGISNKDMDEFYSVANDVFSDIIKYNRYDDSKGEFGGFLYRALDLAIIDELKRQTRNKRTTKIEVEEKDIYGNIEKKLVVIPNVYMDKPIGENGNDTMKDLFISDYNLEDEFIDNQSFKERNVEKYLSSLSKIQRKIIEMKMDGYETCEIQNILHITSKEYTKQLEKLKSYEKKKYLYRSNQYETANVNYEENVMETRTTTSERTKNTSYSIESICKKLKQRRLRDDHVLQRSSGQWNTLFKSELISDILQGRALTPIIISEEIKEGITMHWLIDGKQRCTNIEDFINEGFSISNNVQIYNIAYQTDKIENKKVVLNEDGFPIPENKTFDIRKKKFSQLPEELQDKLKEFQIPVMLNLNCTKKEIAYDIARFNRCRPMTVAQNGFTGLEEGYAEFVDNILKMPFFEEDFIGSSYRESNNKSGMLRRMIVESIMTSDYIDDFNKDFRKMCGYLTENANDSNFINFYSSVERLMAVSCEDVADMFNIKDSFLWFGLFTRFNKLELQDAQFIDFIKEFKSSLHRKNINGVSFDELDEKSTKDKNIVTVKINHMEQLMNEYLHISEADNIEELKTKVVTTYDFIKEKVKVDVMEEDINLYNEILNDLKVEVDNDSKLLEEDNIPSLIAIIAYSCERDIDLDKWFIDYFNRKNTYDSNQKQNYLYMKEDLEQYVHNKDNSQTQKTA